MNPEPSPAREGDLVADSRGGLDRAVQQDLQRIRAESLLARNDAAEELTRDLDALLDAPPVLGDLDRLEGPAVPSFAELESLLAAPETSGLTLEKDLLAELLKDGGEAVAILRKGLVFLKHRKYPEALEWWALHGRGLDPSTSRLSLLMLVMETLTHLWSGHPDRADAARARVTAHPLFRRIRGT